MTSEDAASVPGTREVRVEETDGERRLVVDGVVQSVAVDPGATPHGYWRAMLPRIRPQSALIFGLGGGTVAHLLRRQFPTIQMVGVDNDDEVLTTARNFFDLDTAGISVVGADAFDFARTCDEQFDLVIVDLYRGEALAAYVPSASFLRRVRTLVRPGGTVVWNLHRDQRGAFLRQRARRGLIPESSILVGLNHVLHLRRRRRQLTRHGP